MAGSYDEEQQAKKDTILKLVEKNNQEFKDMQAKHWGLINILENFDIRISLSELIEVCERIKPRYFTIASSQRVSPQKIVLAVTLTIDKINDSTVMGLNSQYWYDIEQKLLSFGDQGGICPKIKIAHQASTFKMPTSPNSECIMIGSGAGVAPFIGMLEEKESGLNANLGNMTLFYGFRKLNEDYLYRDEIARWKSNGTLNKEFVAVSRETDKKVYVQDLLKENKQMLRDNLFGGNDKVLYVCGNLNMANSVRAILEEVIMEELKCSKVDAEKKCEEFMKVDKKVNIEAWG